MTDEPCCSRCGAPLSWLLMSKGELFCIPCGLKAEPPMLDLTSFLRQLSDVTKQVS